MKRTVALGLTVLARLAPAAAVTGCAGAKASTVGTPWNGAPGLNDDADLEPSPRRSPSPSRSTSPSPSPSRKPSRTPKKSSSSTGTIVLYGTTFTLAPGGTGVMGQGTKLKR